MASPVWERQQPSSSIPLPRERWRGDASASGGAVSTGNINSGGNVCNAIGIGNTYADPVVYGGDCLNTTDLGIAVNGGTAISDSSGGNYNLAFVS